MHGILLVLMISFPGGGVLQTETPTPTPSPTPEPGATPTPTPTPTPEPDYTPGDSSTFFGLPSGSLPWTLPSLIIPEDITLADILALIILEEVQHSDDYITDIGEGGDPQTIFDAVQAPLDTVTKLLSDFIGQVGDVDSGGDFDTGLNPEGGAMTAYQFIDNTGTFLGLGFNYSRATRDLFNDFSFGTFDTLVLLMLAAVAWGLFVNMFSFVVQIADVVWTVIRDIIGFITDVVPLW